MLGSQEAAASFCPLCARWPERSVRIIIIGFMTQTRNRCTLRKHPENHPEGFLDMLRCKGKGCHFGSTSIALKSHRWTYGVVFLCSVRSSRVRIGLGKFFEHEIPLCNNFS